MQGNEIPIAVAVTAITLFSFVVLGVYPEGVVILVGALAWVGQVLVRRHGG